MKYFYYILIVSSVFLTQCKKQDELLPPEAKGTKFDLLLKTIDKYPDGESVTTYTYNSDKQLVQEGSLRNFVDGTKWEVITNWYRNANGLPDSMQRKFTYGTDPTGLQNQYYHYSPSGALAYSILFRNKNNLYGSIDSCVYIYSGTSIVKRMDYTSAASTILNNTLTHEMFYQYDLLSNISSITFVNYDFSRGAPARKDTVVLSYLYDQERNPFYQNEDFYAYFVDLTFENYASKNNITRITYDGNSTSNSRDEFSIQYNTANKPDRVMVNSYGVGTARPEIWTTDYYYD